ncbi:MAG: TPM domain-containing protein [Spirochaetaceae bacterium]|jgi:uncharacterized protein|nr:TPM domain-containing protein [Spirochaetaceae bacterium]
MGASSGRREGQRLAKNIFPRAPLKRRCLALLLGLACLGALNALEVPVLTGAFMDNANMLAPGEQAQAAAFLLDFDQKTEAQIAVLIVPSLEGDDIDLFSMRVFDAWKIGAQGKDSGAILVVARDEREVVIKTGYGVEGNLTDAKCGLIIREVIAPAFQRGAYGEGVYAAVQNMAGIILQDETLVSSSVAQKAKAGKSDDPLENPVAAVFFFIIIMIAIGVFSKRRRGGIYGPFAAPGPRRGGGFGGGFSNGGGFSGGGGRSGGGGARGKW